MANEEDLFVWPDGMWRFRCELEEDAVSHKSDDYEVFEYGTDKWKKFMREEVSVEDSIGETLLHLG